MSLILANNEKALYNLESAIEGLLTTGQYDSRLIAAFKPLAFFKKSGYVVVKGQGYCSAPNCRLELHLRGMFPDFSTPRHITIGDTGNEGGAFSFETVIKVRTVINYSDDSGDSLSTFIHGSSSQLSTVYGGIRADGDTSYFMTIGWKSLDNVSVPANYISLRNLIVEYKEQ